MMNRMLPPVLMPRPYADGGVTDPPPAATPGHSLLASILGSVKGVGDDIGGLFTSNAPLGGVMGNAALGAGFSGLTGGNPLVGGTVGAMASALLSKLKNKTANAPASDKGAAGGIDSQKSEMDYLPFIMALASALNSSQTRRSPQQQAAYYAPQLPADYSQHMNAPPLPAPHFNPGSSYYTYGQMPPQQQGNDKPQWAGAGQGVTMASGGLTGLGSAPTSSDSRFIDHGTKANGRQDNIPARLSENEYVLDSESVALLGDGNPDAGAKKLDELRRKIRAHKGKNLAKGKISPDAKDPEQYLGSLT